jgi:acyl carrier protein
LGEALRADPVQALAVRLNADVFAAEHDAIPPLLRELVGDHRAVPGNGAPTGAENPVLAELARAETRGERMLRLEELLRIETSRVLKLAPERVGANQPFGQMGIDSLMALELIRRVNAALGLALPATAVFNYPTLTILAAQIAKRLGFDPVEEAAAARTVTAHRDESAASQAQKDLHEMSEDDALRALMEPGDFTSGQ